MTVPASCLICSTEVVDRLFPSIGDSFHCDDGIVLQGPHSHREWHGRNRFHQIYHSNKISFWPIRYDCCFNLFHFSTSLFTAMDLQNRVECVRCSTPKGLHSGREDKNLIAKANSNQHQGNDTRCPSLANKAYELYMDLTCYHVTEVTDC